MLAPLPLLSVILPVKAPNYLVLRRCMASFAALDQASCVQIVVVYTGHLDFLQIGEYPEFHSVHLKHCEAAGIYSAFNAGIEMAEGSFLLFFGHDDVALPEMDEVLFVLSKSCGGRVVVAAGVYVQGIGVRRATRLRQAVALRNWPHQGMFYSACLFDDQKYDISFPLRADHCLNISFLADRSIRCVRPQQVVSYFSRGGFSTRVVEDKEFDANQADITAKAFGWFWGGVVRYLLPFVRQMRKFVR